MLKSYRYRIYPNKEQEIQLAKTFGCCRFVYNQTLAYRKNTYEKEKKTISKTDCNNYCNRELKEVYTLVISQPSRYRNLRKTSKFQVI